jgi:Flp pilus assembly protein TadG
MIELALALPLLAFGLLGGTDMARAYAVQLAVQNGARAAAEGTALDATPTSVEAVAHAQQEMDRTPGMNSGNATITVIFAQANKITPCTGALNTSIAGTSTIAAPCYVFVRVRYTFSTLIPWPGIPHTFNFDRSTTFRRYQ